METLLAERLLCAPGRHIRYTVICLRPAVGPLADRLRAAGLAVVDLSGGPRALLYARLARTVRALRPDVVNLHSPIPAVALRLTIGLRRPRPVLLSTVHSTRYRRPTMLLDRLTRRLDDHTVAVSPQVARSATVHGARAVSTRVHGVDLAAQRAFAAGAAAVRAEHGITASDFLAVHVANFRAQKNHRHLIRAAARVTAANPAVRFLLAGSGPLQPVVAADLALHRLGDRVRILGPVPRAGRLIAAADLLVLASHYEGLPVVVMEALAAGVPVVSTAVGGIPDLVRDGHNGLLVPPGSPAALATAILAAAEPRTHRRLREGAARSAGDVDIARTAEWFEELYARHA
ncbi:glycosyltransferase [Dactylosporangium vinaceum]|uniref:Glycosyltransferase n=1 Tax=Dactylosporangium vinaceum TaxID=53362 RepID=A0ABV5MRC5_9ACTN|nr:glycosyltransferase [Dactylosporangium vinaceum]UAC00528.1 glycosyltransferase [Dactylosporangium vinaceum]